MKCALWVIIIPWGHNKSNITIISSAYLKPLKEFLGRWWCVLSNSPEWVDFQLILWSKGDCREF